jgi:probable HAF family extracellular repeat protein
MRKPIAALAVAVLLSFSGRGACGQVRYTLTDLGTLPGGVGTFAYGINDSGQVVGSGPVGDGSGANRAFLYSSGTMTDLGTLGSASFDSSAVAINASGQVVGRSGTWSGQSHAFLYSNGTMTDLGALGGSASCACGINASGQIVGYFDAAAEHAFVYSDGTMTDLNSVVSVPLGWTIQDAMGINASGQIAGTMYDPTGECHAVLLTPVPEPCTIVLLGLGALSLLAYAWRRRAKAA